MSYDRRVRPVQPEARLAIRALATAIIDAGEHPSDGDLLVTEATKGILEAYKSHGRSEGTLTEFFAAVAIEFGELLSNTVATVAYVTGYDKPTAWLGIVTAIDDARRERDGLAG